jgi:radical SAM enzyme (TIGR01210 family)
MYPATRGARDRFVLERRAPRIQHDPWRYQHLIVEHELTRRRTVEPTATVFLTGQECAWRCVMCDLWQYTTTNATPNGAIAAQLAQARNALDGADRPATQLKLYNASNFFDPRAVPDDDYDGIATGLEGLERVIVESHPALIGDRVDRFIEALDRRARGTVLEVAIGLETANPRALEQLNKGLSRDQFSQAAHELTRRGVDVRVFLLISPPFIHPDEQDRWLVESVDYAMGSGASIVSLIPTRAGNGAMDALAAQGSFHPPDLADIERSVALALQNASSGLVFVDLWDLDRFSRCSHCFDWRRGRLQAMNLEQRSQDAVACVHCGHGRPR